MKSVHEILGLYQFRTHHGGTYKSKMRNLRDHYNGDLVIPLPELDTAEEPAVANLLTQGLDQTAMRISSMMPNLEVPPPSDGDRDRKYAGIKRRAILGWWERSALDLQLGKRARHLIGYGQTVSQVRYDKTVDCPIWVARDPLTAYPSYLAGIDNMTPEDCIFAYAQTMGWLKATYPDIAARFVNRSAGRLPPDTGDDGPIDVIEYHDHEEHVLIAASNPRSGQVVAEELERTENRIGRCPVVVGSRINLDGNQSQFEGMLGMYQQQAKLMALEVIAVQKGIFPDTWLEGIPGAGQPKIITNANGLTGTVGIVRDGKLRDLQLQPGFMTNPTIDRLERGQRLTAGIPAEFGGESASNIRTGRRGESVLRQTVDFNVQESQKVIARSLTHEVAIATATARAYGGGRPRSFYVSFAGAKGNVDYTPNKHLVDDHAVVSYAKGASDSNELVIGGGQRVQLGTLSKRDFMRIDPYVEDAEATADRIVAEQLEEGLLAGIQQQAAQGAIPPGDIARMMELVAQDKKNLAGAVMQVQKEAQERQATQVDPGSPEAQPGIAQPGAGAEAAAPTPPASPEAGLRELLGAL